MNCQKHSYTYTCHDTDPCPYCKIIELETELDGYKQSRRFDIGIWEESVGTTVATADSLYEEFGRGWITVIVSPEENKK